MVSWDGKIKHCSSVGEMSDNNEVYGWQVTNNIVHLQNFLKKRKLNWLCMFSILLKKNMFVVKLTICWIFKILIYVCMKLNYKINLYYLEKTYIYFIYFINVKYK